MTRGSNAFNILSNFLHSVSLNINLTEALLYRLRRDNSTSHVLRYSAKGLAGFLCCKVSYLFEHWRRRMPRKDMNNVASTSIVRKTSGQKSPLATRRTADGRLRKRTELRISSWESYTGKLEKKLLLAKLRSGG